MNANNGRLYYIYLYNIMTANNLRLGLTESTLLYIYYMNNINKNAQIQDNETDFKTLYDLTQCLINYLYSTSGYYNKNDKLDSINFETIHSNDNYVNYMNKLISSIKNSTTCIFHLHKLPEIYYQHLSDFTIFLDNKLIFSEFYYNYSDDVKYNETFTSNTNIINNSKNILLINPLSKLFISQFDNNNMFSINKSTFFVNKNMEYNNFILNKDTNLIAFENRYTFFNNGPNNNNLETFEKMCDELLNINSDYETAIISCGSYSLLFADFIHKLHKNVIILGGSEINTMFGIKHQRYLDFNPNFIYNEHWIDIPEELKPECYKNIENGCYW